jgi:excinuclease ABC subunit A
MDHIFISGARQHNLKNVSLELPHNKLIVITGVSGSGKSSLAFDTLFAEGQRRYLESLSTHARQFLQQLDRPDVDFIEGLNPAIAIEQKGLTKNPRSTVGTLTEIYDYLRLLFARLGTVHCPKCGLAVRAYTIVQMMDEILLWPSDSRLWVLAPLGEVTAERLPKLMGKLSRDGFLRVRIDGMLISLDTPLRLPRRPAYRVEVVVDRLVLNPEKLQRLSESLELGARLGQGMVSVSQEQGVERHFTEQFRCLNCNLEMAQPTLSLFSFNHPAGACPHCKGLGIAEEGTSKLARKASAESMAAAAGLPGSERSPTAGSVCPGCQGSRLNEQARSVKFGGLAIHQVSGLSIEELQDWITTVELAPAQKEIASRALAEVIKRVRTMLELGLSYLSLDRAGNSLSGGEAQRIRLTNQISTQLSGVLYVLDEPSIGLHVRDHQRLLDILLRLRDAGNTVVVVEHDPITMMQADYVVDMGPGAGLLGGEVIFAGAPAELLQHPHSTTALYLSGRKQIPLPTRRKPAEHGWLRLSGARGHNLKGVDAAFPLGCITTVTGVSGSGKSTLILQTLFCALSQQLQRSLQSPLPFDSLEGQELVNKIIHIDQTPLDRTPRSNPATYTGILSLIRNLYAQLPESRARGYHPNRFSFNVKGGRCEVCKGEGRQRIDMQFLPAVHVTCPACQGSRYRQETLEILYKGQSIADVLAMTVHQATSFFENIPEILRKLAMLQEVGLGYLALGQPATQLSGGEAQRIKLARELSRKSTGMTVYILDEPTTGLHFEDIQRLLHVLQRLANLGNTIIIIEHNLDVIKSADYVVDLGPEGGDAGGYVVTSGTLEEVMQAPTSYTGQYLRRHLGRLT